MHGEQEEDEADFAQFFEPLLKRKEFEESLNPASKWIRYACGERCALLMLVVLLMLVLLLLVLVLVLWC